MSERTRSTGPIIDYDAYQHLFDGVPDRPPVDHEIYHFFKTIDDVTTPNYREKIARGDVINNPCTLSTSLRTAGGGSYRVTQISTGKAFTNGGGGSLTTFADSHLSNSILGTLPSEVAANPGFDLNAVLAQALANIDSTPYAFGEDLFEIRETLKFLRKPLGSLFQLAESFSKRFRQHPYKTSKRLRSLSDVWLSYRFAASPLVRSVNDALDALQKGTKLRPNRRTARGKQSHQIKGEDVWSESGLTFSRKGERNADFRASILYEVRNPVLDARGDLGLRFKDIPYTMWQVMPYSFMIDRVVNISEYIRGFVNLSDPGVNILAATSTLRDERISSVRFVDQVLSGYSTDIVDGDEVIDSQFDYDRSVIDYQQLLSVKPVVNLTGLVDDATKILDLSTLILARVLGAKRLTYDPKRIVFRRYGILDHY